MSQVFYEVVPQSCVFDFMLWCLKLRILAIGNIHGDFELFSHLFRVIESEGRFDVVFITGNIGRYSTTKKVMEFISKFGYEVISVYGSDDDYYLKQLLRRGEHKLWNGVILNLGGLIRVHGYKILGIGGLKGSGKYWYEWRERTILKIIENVSGRKIDFILAYEFPKNYSPECSGKEVCGRFSLKELVDEVQPKFYIGGRNHGEPKGYLYDNGTIIVESGSIKTKSGESYATVINVAKKVVDVYKLVDKNMSLASRYRF